MFKSVKKEIVTIPAQMSYLSQIRDFIDQIGRKHRFSDKITNSFKLVVDEACTNVIEHGYAPDDPNKEITIRMEINTSKLVLTVIDHAKPFDILRYKPRNINDLKEEGRNGGLGIRLIKRIMDTIDYRTTSDGYNELIMTKYFKYSNQNKEVKVNS